MRPWRGRPDLERETRKRKKRGIKRGSEGEKGEGSGIEAPDLSFAQRKALRLSP